MAIEIFFRSNSFEFWIEFALLFRLHYSGMPVLHEFSDNRTADRRVVLIAHVNGSRLS